MPIIPKFFVAAGFFLLCLVHRTVDADCSFTYTFGDGTNLDTRGLEPFNVAPGGVTTCSVSCSAGSTTNLWVLYGGHPTLLWYDGHDLDFATCAVQTVIASGREEYQLGYWLTVTSPYNDVQLNCECDKPGDGDDRRWCFSESAKVEVLNRGVVAMKDLEVGDMVLTGNNRYEPVYSFGHKEEATELEFLQIYTTPEDPLEISADHMVFVVDTKSGAKTAVRAGAVKVGDVLDASGTSALVTKIATVQKQGLYMPLTLDGTIVVDGIKASTYVSIEDEAPKFLALRSYFGNVSEQTIFHWWLSPLRMLCTGVSSKFCSDPQDDEQGIMKWLLNGRKVLMFGEEQHVVVQVFALALPIFFLFAFLNLVEFVFGPALAPGAMLMMGASLLWVVGKNRHHVHTTKKQV